MPENSRFKDLGNGSVVETIATQTQLFYDPTTQQARAIFNGATFLDVNGQYVSVGQDIDILRVDFADKMTDRIAVDGDVDPITGADLTQITIAGAMLLIKRAYDHFHNARAAEIAAAVEPPSALPEPTPSEE